MTLYRTQQMKSIKFRQTMMEMRAGIIPATPIRPAVQSARLVPTGTKIWPLKGKNLGQLWCATGTTMQREYRTSLVQDIPDSNKFSRFIDLNKSGKTLYMATMFDVPKVDPNDVAGVLTYGFVMDLYKTSIITD